MRRAQAKNITVPASGMVKGGRMDGWRFHFVCFRVVDRALEVVARWTPPHWPFFREFGADRTHFGTLRPRDWRARTALAGRTADRIGLPRRRPGATYMAHQLGHDAARPDQAHAWSYPEDLT